MPRVTTAVGYIECRTTEVEVVAIGVACVDAEVPESCIPIDRTIEVLGCEVCAVLPVEEYVTEVEITTLPINSIDIVHIFETHEVVEVYLVCSLVLLVGEVEFIGHLVGEEEGLFACLFVAHGIGVHGQGQHEGQGCK